jgi:hypothetical protein
MLDQTTQGLPTTEQTGCLGAVIRLVWLAVGNAALLFLAVAIAQRRALLALDLTFWAIVVGLVVLRYIDITRFGGLTTDGKPASLQHWRRYLVLLLLVAGGLWALAHGVAFFTVS